MTLLWGKDSLGFLQNPVQYVGIEQEIPGEGIFSGERVKHAAGIRDSRAPPVHLDELVAKEDVAASDGLDPGVSLESLRWSCTAMDELQAPSHSFILCEFRVLEGSNALTGESEWILVGDGGDGGDASDPLAESSYLDMLNDRARNRAFSSAIAKVGRHGHVLDIGAGTGLLSLMAWRAMEEQCQVTACESFLPMYKLARKVCRDNGTMGAIKLLHMGSDEIKVGVDISSKADALVCEILDSELLGEGIIPSLRNAHEHLLRPNAATVPYRATVYAQSRATFSGDCTTFKG
ncbi:protein arginine N-methyltransferase 1.6-like isoform X2 [Selaginella moellendorffii]|uniref:protein arginine N-methyltransferase 1.6-like isoform X2 n=1 Tax=Selaginella moellendorffii TaxID=88036 RepID=UPI000D1C8D0D|nr:protein arginine N-methyltransferase 1.6-like isoform X2 [Selaginella moellendorffii]|eukprot:XP_024515991.1 protein arginine N-methyltransferase 1.6-like isoform X2 [Selaginella moellendorffii]